MAIEKELLDQLLAGRDPVAEVLLNGDHGLLSTAARIGPGEARPARRDRIDAGRDRSSAGFLGEQPRAKTVKRRLVVLRQ